VSEISQDTKEKIEVLDLENKKNLKKKDTTVCIVLRATVSFLVTFVLFCVIFISVFPYRSMIVSFNMGMERSALHHAQRVVRRYESRDTSYNSRFADGLFLAQSIASDKLNNSIENRGINHRRTQQYAKTTYHHLSLLLNEHLATTSMRTASIIDPARLSTALLRSHHPYLYSYMGVLRARYVRASYASGFYEVLLERLYADSSMLITMSIYEFTFFMIELNALISMGYLDVLIVNGEISPILQRLKNTTQILVNIIEQAPSLSVIGLEDRYLRRTWSALHLLNLTTTIRNALGTLRIRYPNNDIIANAFTHWITYNYGVFIQINEEKQGSIPMSTWYSILLMEYVGRQ